MDKLKWDNDAHLRLCVALAEALESAGGSIAQQKDKITQVMNAGGQTFTWEAIRYEHCDMAKWDVIKGDLFEALIFIHGIPQFSKAEQESVTAFLRRRGHDMSWDAIRGIHEDLVLALVDEMKPSGLNWENILTQMHGNGYQFTRKALSMSSTQGKTIWDERAHVCLLQAVISIAPPNSTQWEKIIERVRSQGYNYTSSAALQHLQKLRRNAPAGDASGANGPKTPKGKGATTKAPPTKSTSGKGKRKMADAGSEEAGATDDLETVNDTPTKKKVKQEDPNIKAEDEGAV